jgi:hypothetical protein
LEHGRLVPPCPAGARFAVSQRFKRRNCVVQFLCKLSESLSDLRQRQNGQRRDSMRVVLTALVLLAGLVDLVIVAVSGDAA